MSLSTLLSKVNITRIASKYKTYIKYSASVGGAIGFTFSIAHISDLDYKISDKEKILYPIAGTIGGAFIGVSVPIWIIFAPVVYLFGRETAGTLAKGIFISGEKKNEFVKSDTELRNTNWPDCINEDTGDGDIIW